MECLIVNFVDKIVQFLAQRLHGYTCNRNHFKRDAEEKHLIFPSSLPFLSKNPLFKGVSKDSSLTSSLTYPSLIPHMILHIVTCINRNQICRFHFMMPECYGRDGVREMWGICEGFSGPLTCRISLVQRLFRRKCEGWDRKELLHIKSSKWACFAIWSWQNQGYVYNDAY